MQYLQQEFLAVDPLLRAETTINIKLLTLLTDIISKYIMDDKLSAEAAGEAFLTLETRDNMNAVTNTTLSSHNEFHKNDNQTVAEQCELVYFIHDVIWFDYKQRRVVNNPNIPKDWAVYTMANVERTQDCYRKDCIQTQSYSRLDDLSNKAAITDW